ncbi:MAG: hypothetical protein JST81_11895 [Bacteroidetes bacterium]|nr:hypothetical protein [Bacteroidota bacterium]
MIRLYLLIAVISSTNVVGQVIQKEGIMNLNSPLFREAGRCYTWFKDSTVIHEMYIEYSETINDSVISHGVRIYKYSVLDLTKKRGQDYVTFSDTAKPITNYSLDPEDVSYGFYPKKHIYDKYMDSLIALSDTIVKGIVYKRLYFDLSGQGWSQRLIYYLAPLESDNIFHLSRILDSCYPAFKVSRIQFVDKLTGYSDVSSLEVIRDWLTSSEQNVIEAWKQNIDTTSLPLTSKREADRIFAQFKANN